MNIYSLLDKKKRINILMIGKVIWVFEYLSSSDLRG